MCDQGASNKSAINQLKKETEDKYLRNNGIWSKNTFEIDGKELFSECGIIKNPLSVVRSLLS